MVEIEGLSKQYGEQFAIQDLHFEVKSGEILGFLGPNGAGKSTTMKILTGYVTPSAGTARIDGFDVQTDSLAVRQRVGYLPEHNPLYLDMYVHEFLAFVGRMYGLKKQPLRKRIEEVIEMTGLGREQHKQIGALSKGYRQRVGLCQALIHDPKVLILDEPTSGLDPNQIVDIRELVKTIGQEKTVIFSSHILSEVESIAERVIIINQGQMIADEATADLASLAEDGIQITIELSTPGFDPTVLTEWPTVKRVEALSTTQWVIHTPTEVDIRPQIFEEIVQQQQVLIGMHKRVINLEDAFRRLTQRPPVPTN